MVESEDQLASQIEIARQKPVKKFLRVTTLSIWNALLKIHAMLKFKFLQINRGNVIHLGERDCSMQRRNQKFWRKAQAL